MERVPNGSPDRSSERSPESADSPERDPALRANPQALGRSAVAAQQREERVQELAPKLGRTAIGAQRREEIDKAVVRQLGRKAVERDAHRNRD
jgi:hypothetical protein